MTSDDLAYLSAIDLVEGYRSGALSPVDVIDACLSRIERFNGAINAFTLIDAEGARRRARDSEARWRNASPQGALDGVPFTAKDNLMVAGLPFRRGARVTPTTPVSESAPIVERALEAGAAFIGLTTMPEFGLGPVTISPLTGSTGNAWDPGKQAGGSSGGAAAGVAAGFSTFALGTDAGGSLRIPAALNGVVGFKASAGRVPAFPPSVAGALSCPGPITRNVSDAALFMTVAVAPDHRDTNALPPQPVAYRESLKDGVKGLRVAVSHTLGYATKADPEISAALERAAGLLAGLGAHVEHTEPKLDDPVDFYVTLLESGYRHSLRHLTAEQRLLLSPALRNMLEAQKAPQIDDYIGALDKCLAYARVLSDFHRHYDLLVTPTVAVPAFARERSYPAEFEGNPNPRAWTPFTALFNLTHQPAVSLPAGLTVSGLPIGVQIVGPKYQELRVLRAAYALEQAIGFDARPPLSQA